MSWDIVIFKLNKKVIVVEEIEENVLVEFPTNKFKEILTHNFSTIQWDENRALIKGKDWELETFIPEENSFSNTVFRLFGEQAVYALVEFCRKEGWQAFDTALGEMLNLDHPEKNGYQNFQVYLDYIKNNSYL